MKMMKFIRIKSVLAYLFMLLCGELMAQGNQWEIGQEAEDGIVFYLNEEGTGGFVVRNGKIGKTEWGCNGNSIENAINTFVGGGLENTNAIVEACATSNIAAQLCYDFEENGLDDWFLPSKEALELIFNTVGPGGDNLLSIDPWNHWSSSQSSSGQAYKLTFSSDGNGVASGSNKSSSYRVLPIRAFGTIQYGCQEETACNFDPIADYEDGTCDFNDADSDGICDAEEIVGCQDVVACNYDALATDAGTCIYNEEGYDCDGNWVLAVGDVYQGGIVFYLDDSSTRGMICTAEDIVSAPWGCDYEDLPGVHLSYFGSGKINSEEIIASCNEVSAASLCAEYNIEGYEDWFLPSKDELLFIYQSIGQGSSLGNVGGFANNWYWSSTEIDDHRVSMRNFTNGATYNQGKSSSRKIRAIRTFGDWEEGCMIENSCTYSSTAVLETGLCSYPEEYYDCLGQCLNDTDSDNVCDEFEIVGCQDEVGCNYNALATDYGNCVYSQEYYDCEGVCVNDADSDGICDESEVLGCQDALACNYNALATDAGTCIYNEEGYDCDGNWVLEVGDVYQGGIVFYMDDSSTRGMICSAEDIASAPWGCDYEDLLGAHRSYFGSGKINSEEIIASCNEVSAASLCAEYIIEGYEDWFLPSKDELLLIYQSIGQGSSIGNIGGFANNWYWSSTEVDDHRVSAYNFTSGSIFNQGKSSNRKIRAIRTFGDWEEGCMIENSCTYSSTAVLENDLCTYPEEYYDCLGQCLNDTDSDNVCDEFEIVGCQDALACNYDATATDAGTCIYNEEGYDCDGNWVLAVGDAYQDGIVFYMDESGTKGLVVTASEIGNVKWGCQGAELQGADGVELGYGPQNTADIIANCSDENTAAILASTYESLGAYNWYLPTINELHLMYQNIGQGSALGNVGNFLGGTIRYWSSTEKNIDRAWYMNFGEGVKTNYYKNSLRQVRAVHSFGDWEEGCMDTQACNFAELAEFEDGFCIYNEEYYDCEGVCVNDADSDGICDELEIEGCMNADAFDYNPLATDSGQCNLPFNYEYTMTLIAQVSIDGTLSNSLMDQIEVVDENGATVGISNFDTHIGALGNFAFVTIYSHTYYNNYSVQIQLDGGELHEFEQALSFVANANNGAILDPVVFQIGLATVFGCTDDNYLEYDLLANTDNGSCVNLIVEGCTDENYLEYNSLANTDNNSCLTLLLNGCMDNSASNYNQNANVDDGSCISWEDAYVSLQAAFSDQHSALSTQQDSIQALNLELETQNSTLESLTIENAGLNASLESQSELVEDYVLSVSNLQFSVDSLQGAISNQQSAMSLQEDSIIGLNASLDSQSELVEDYVLSVSSLQFSVDSLQGAISNQQSAFSLQEDSIQILNLELETQNSTLDSLTSELEEAQENQETHSEVTRNIELPQGWSIFGYTCADSVNVIDALGVYENQIEIVKDEWGLAWLVEWNYNALGTLQYGQGYQIKTTEAIDEFQFCPNIE